MQMITNGSADQAPAEIARSLSEAQAMTLIVQSDFNVLNTAPMAEAARALGIPMIDIALGFKPEAMPVFSGVPFLYGSVGLIRWAMEQPALRDHVAWGEQELSPVTWVERLGDLYLNHDGRGCRAGDAPGGWHVRPIRNDKSFTGMIAPVPAEFADVASWAAPPKQIDEEVRVFVVDHRFVQASVYRRNGEYLREACEPPPIPADTWAPFANCVMDLALVDGAWEIVEFNSIHSSGWYACDPATVLSAVRAAILGEVK